MKPMRKASRQKDAAWALEVFDKAPYVTVSMTRPDGTPYGLPLSLCRKDNFTEYFHSAVAIGRAETVEDDAEKTEALRLLCERFLPKHMDHFNEAIERSLRRTTIVRITLTEPPVGKCKP